MKRTLFCILTITCFLLSACADNTNTASNTSSSAAPVLHKTKSGITYQVFDKPISDKVSLDYTVLAKDQDPLIITVTMIDESDESKGLEYHGYTLRENGWKILHFLGEALLINNFRKVLPLSVEIQMVSFTSASWTRRRGSDYFRWGIPRTIKKSIFRR